ncbi:COG4705 family protein [Zhengella sedimenti]|uniref:hypothetical protein n=1 Tax=Zhengella sedimenti TaxID=3390035 RepID=UPI003975D655
MGDTLEKAGCFHAPLSSESLNKIAEVTLAFWIMKITATTLGETTGDFIAQTLNLGYVAGLGITGAMLAAILFFQVRANAFHPALFWAAIVATTTADTEISDMMDRTLGLGYATGSVILTAGIFATLAFWRWRDGNLSVDPIQRRDAEITSGLRSCSPTASERPSAIFWWTMPD